MMVPTVRESASMSVRSLVRKDGDPCRVGWGRRFLRVISHVLVCVGAVNGTSHDGAYGTTYSRLLSAKRALPPTQCTE